MNLALSLSFLYYPCLSKLCLRKRCLDVFEEARRNFKFTSRVIYDVIGSRVLTMAAPRSASPDNPPPAPPRPRLSIPSETGNIHLLPPRAEGISQPRAQTLERVNRKVSSEAPRKKNRPISVHSPTRPKPPTMSIVAEPTTKIKVADLVENCRYSGWVRKQGGSYKSCEFTYLLPFSCLKFGMESVLLNACELDSHSVHEQVMSLSVN